VPSGELQVDFPKEHALRGHEGGVMAVGLVQADVHELEGVAFSAEYVAVLPSRVATARVDPLVAVCASGKIVPARLGSCVGAYVVWPSLLLGCAFCVGFMLLVRVSLASL